MRPWVTAVGVLLNILMTDDLGISEVERGLYRVMAEVANMLPQSSIVRLHLLLGMEWAVERILWERREARIDEAEKRALWISDADYIKQLPPRPPMSEDARRADKARMLKDERAERAERVRERLRQGGNTDGGAGADARRN